jgi:hypothetical protein
VWTIIEVLANVHWTSRNLRASDDTSCNTFYHRDLDSCQASMHPNIWHIWS